VRVPFSFSCAHAARKRRFVIAKKVAEYAHHEKFPFMVNVVSPTTTTHICSGALIADDLAIAPASCVSKSCKKCEPFPIIRVGSNSIDGEDETGDVQEYNVIEQRVHNKFDGTVSAGYDVAILQLDGKTKDVPIIGGYKALRDLGDSDVIMALGWFKASRIGAPSALLQMITSLDYVPQEKCMNVFPKLPEASVCAKPKMRAHCEWDHGAPLLLCTKGIGNYMLAGLASFERSTCQTDDPYVYADVGGELLNWVEAQGLEDSVIEKPANSGIPPEKEEL